MADKYVIGVDFGTDSVRAVVVNAFTGSEEATDAALYRRWKAGLYCDPEINQFRQHPLDYVEGLEQCVRGALQKVSKSVSENVVGIGVDTTGSTPGAVDENGVPLAMRDEFAENPNAMFVLWKDHTAVKEAAEINEKAWHCSEVDYTKYVGGVYSSEWFWSKILHIIRNDEKVRQAAFSWVEYCDWIPAMLTGTEHPSKLKRSRCAAGHKAMWHSDWDGLPPEEFWVLVDPLLQGLRHRLYRDTYPSDEPVGTLTKEWANRLGLSENVVVAVGAFDAHMGAVGGGIAEGALVKIMGTSTCDVMVASDQTMGNKLVKGICGQVDGSVIPGMVGMEAGQSAFGDVFAWFRELMMWPLRTFVGQGVSPNDLDALESRMLQTLTEQASRLGDESVRLLALDWLNGRRTPYADQELKGAILGLNLGTTAPKIFKALVDATAFGAKAVVDRFREEGVRIDEVIALGGIPKKNEFIMQVTADVFDMPIKVVRSDQACALGAAMFGAVAAGLHDTIQEAQKKMCSGFSHVYHPNPENVDHYQSTYAQYLRVGRDLEEYLRTL